MFEHVDESVRLSSAKIASFSCGARPNGGDHGQTPVKLNRLSPCMVRPEAAPLPLDFVSQGKEWTLDKSAII